MTPLVATFIYVIGIAGLFFLDRDKGARVSSWLWIPLLWLLIVGSRPVSIWFQSGPTISQSDQNLDGSPIDAAIFGVLVLAGIVVLVMRSRKVKTFLRANWPILLFFSFCALSIAWSDYSFIAFKRWIKAIGDVIMVLIVLTDPDPPIATKRFFSRASFLLLPISMLFIKYYPDLGRAYDHWTWTPMYTGVTTFKNLLGMTCLVCGLGSLWSFMGAYLDKQLPHRLRHMIAHGTMVLMAIWLIHTANSMTSLACLLMAGTLLFIPLQKRYRTRSIVAQCLIWGTISLSVFNLFIGSGWMLQSLGRDATLTGRTDIWKAVLSMHTNPLLGTGYESFWMGSRLQQVDRMTENGIQEAHNGYLEVYLNLGFVGIALLAGIIISGYRNALAVFKRDPQAGRLRLAFFAAGVIYSFTEAGFRMLTPIWVGFLFAATCIPLERERRPQARAAKSPFENKVEKVLEPAGALRIDSALGELDAPAPSIRSGRISGFTA